MKHFVTFVTVLYYCGVSVLCDCFLFLCLVLIPGSLTSDLRFMPENEASQVK